MSEELKGFLIAAIILAVLALFVPCMESIIKALRPPKKAPETRPKDSREDSYDGFIA